jgi:hypothetical protein
MMTASYSRSTLTQLVAFAFAFLLGGVLMVIDRNDLATSRRPAAWILVFGSWLLVLGGFMLVQAAISVVIPPLRVSHGELRVWRPVGFPRLIELDNSTTVELFAKSLKVSTSDKKVLMIRDQFEPNLEEIARQIRSAFPAM